jgi:NADH-quinone oxidoreductase subunit D
MPYTFQPDTTYGLDIEEVGYPNTSSSTPDRWVLNFGPQHPATHTTLRLLLELDGERVARCTPHIGYLHSGFEKLGEHHDYNQYVCTVSRTNYVSPIVNDIAWHSVCEKLFDIDVTPRCKVVRTIMCELGRIQDHLLSIGAAALDLGGFTGFLYGFNEREFILDIVEYLSGQRFHPDWTRLGGAWRDIADDEVFKTMVKNFINKRLPRAQKDLETLLNRNRIFVDRLRGVGVISAEDAISCSLSGPVARASGVRRDMRKDEPYLCHAPNWDGAGAEPVEFDVAISTDGDCLSRYLVRHEELRQSARIILQLIDNIPSGPMDTLADSKALVPSQANVLGSIEGTIQLFELKMFNRGIDAPVGEFYGSIESPNGELGYYIVANGTHYPWRARTRPPSFLNFSVMARLVEGHLLSDVVAVLGSLNIIAAELDR